MNIQLKTIDPSGKTKIMNAKTGVSLAEVKEIMENEVLSGYAVYAAVLLDGEIYEIMELSN